MPIDPWIPLQAGQNIPNFGDDPQKLLSMQMLAMRMQQLKQVQQGENALKSMFSNQDNFDPKTKLPKPEAVNALTAISPQAGMDLWKNIGTIQNHQLQNSYRQSEIYGNVNKRIKDASVEAYGMVQSLVKDGMQPEAARQKVETDFFAPAMNSLDTSGFVDEAARRTIPRKLDMSAVAGFIMNPLQRMQEERAEQGAVLAKKADARAEKTSSFSETTDPKMFEYRNQDGKVDRGELIYNKERKAYYSIDDAGQDRPVKVIRPIASASELTASKEIAILDKDGNVLQRIAARERKDGPGWIRSDNGEPVKVPEGGKIDVGAAANASVMGSREQALLQRQLGAGMQAAAAIKDVVALPSTVSTGIFGGRGQEIGIMNAAKETLVNEVTSQDVQAYNALMPGLSRSLAFIDSQGLQPGVSFTNSFNAEMLKEGDSVQTKMLKLARQREIVETGMDTLLTNAKLGPEQRKAAEKVKENMAQAVPWTPIDVVKLMRADDPKATLQTVGSQATGKGEAAIPPAGGAPSAGAGRTVTLKAEDRTKWDDTIKTLTPGDTVVFPDGSHRRKNPDGSWTVN